MKTIHVLTIGFLLLGLTSERCQASAGSILRVLMRGESVPAILESTSQGRSLVRNLGLAGRGVRTPDDIAAVAERLSQYEDRGLKIAEQLKRADARVREHPLSEYQEARLLVLEQISKQEIRDVAGVRLPNPLKEGRTLSRTTREFLDPIHPQIETHLIQMREMVKDFEVGMQVWNSIRIGNHRSLEATYWVIHIYTKWVQNFEWTKSAVHLAQVRSRVFEVNTWHAELLDQSTRIWTVKLPQDFDQFVLDLKPGTEWIKLTPRQSLRNEDPWRLEITLNRDFASALRLHSLGDREIRALSGN